VVNGLQIASSEFPSNGLTKNFQYLRGKTHFLWSCRKNCFAPKVLNFGVSVSNFSKIVTVDKMLKQLNPKADGASLFQAQGIATFSPTVLSFHRKGKRRQWLSSPQARIAAGRYA
jgi:hypothetical protein